MKAGGDPPVPEPPWEYPRISAAVHRQAWGIAQLGFLFLEVGPPAKAKEE